MFFQPHHDRMTHETSRKSSPGTPVSTLRHVKRQEDKVKMKKNMINTINDKIKSSAIRIGIKSKKTMIFTEQTETNSSLENGFDQIWVRHVFKMFVQ